MGSTIPCSYISVVSSDIFGTMERFIPGRCMKPISGIFQVSGAIFTAGIVL